MSGSSLQIVLPAPRLPERSRNARASVIVTVALHALAAAALVSIAVSPPASQTQLELKPAARERMQLPRMVFLQRPGPGGGGGGGGNRQPAPPSRASNVGRDRMTLPVARAERVVPNPVEVPSEQRVAIDAIPLMSGTTYAMGMPEAAPSLGFSQGPGVGGGVGTGVGSGIGAGTGPGFGEGSGGGFGGGVYRPGNGVTAPTLLSQVRPNYTPDAMRRRIQGTVVLEMIVGADGVPYDLRVVRSLDEHGLDDEAIKAARQWRFKPGLRGETPVDVLVILVIDFHMR
jgi:periplasmic protein TonB